MQTGNYNFRKNVATDLKYILRKMSLKFENPKSYISVKIASVLYIFCYKLELFGVKTEAVVLRCSIKKVFLEISQNSQESTWARVSFLIKLQAGL